MGSHQIYPLLTIDSYMNGFGYGNVMHINGDFICKCGTVSSAL